MKRPLELAVCALFALTCTAPRVTATSTPLPTITVAPATTTPAVSPPTSSLPSLAPSPTPTAARSPSTSDPGRAPYCAVDDVPTPNRDYAHPEQTYLDWTHTLTDSYQPPDLVSALTGVSPRVIIPEPGVTAADTLVVKGKPGYEAVLADDRNALARKTTYSDLTALRDAARSDGFPLVIVSAYRSYAQQVLTFEYWVGIGGYAQALRTSARPGHSEHQLGTTIDFGDGSAAPWEYDDWAATPTGGWLTQHAADLGFVVSYPWGKSAITCYDYEPWHYRWVGRDVARPVVASGRPLREFQTGIR
ncbi:MAG TPA: D-alanyl-D-alanine carboxypeptidase family protein [Candidatus Limnocylindria bacterium]